jgi:hypothetical protein
VDDATKYGLIIGWFALVLSIILFVRVRQYLREKESPEVQSVDERPGRAPQVREIVIKHRLREKLHSDTLGYPIV